MGKQRSGRRDFLRMTGIIAGAGLVRTRGPLGLGATLGLRSFGVVSSQSDSNPPDYILRIAPSPVEIAPRHIVSTITYNGQFPGPSWAGCRRVATGYPKQRETTLGLGGRRALNKAKTRNLLLMGGRSFQAISASNSQPSWIAYVGIQVLLGPKEQVTPQVEQKLPEESKP